MEYNSNINYEREQLRKFIIAYRNLPILWDVKFPDYSKKDKRNQAYEKLLHVYKPIKYDATVTDVKRKINSIRSNFRKEMKKVEESAAIGIQHRPSSWMYDELVFLQDSEISVPCVSSLLYPAEEDDSRNDNDGSHSGENDIPPPYPQYPPNKKQRFSDASQSDGTTRDVAPNHPQFSVKRPRYLDSNQCDVIPRNVAVPPMSYTEEITKVWAEKLKHLEPLQRLFAEKAINDVLFEGQLRTLHRNSVKINVGDRSNLHSNDNDLMRAFEPSQSSPEYKFSQSQGFTEDDHN